MASGRRQRRSCHTTAVDRLLIAYLEFFSIKVSKFRNSKTSRTRMDATFNWPAQQESNL